MMPAAAVTPPTVADKPIVLQPGTVWWRLFDYLQRQQLTGKPVTVILRLGDCPVNWLKGVPDGR